MKQKEIMEEIEKLKQYAEILGTPDEYFRHMNGHKTELSLILSAFEVAKNGDIILSALEKQQPKAVENTYSEKLHRIHLLAGDCPVCKSVVPAGQWYCWSCGQRLAWPMG